MAAEALTLTAAEMAVLMEPILGPAAGDGTGQLADLGLTTAALDQARAALLARGLLRPAPDRSARRTFVVSDARMMLIAAARPMALGALTITRPGRPEHGVYFSWTPEIFLYNTVDGGGLYHLEPLASLEAAAEVIVRECGLLDFTPDVAAPAPASPDDVARNATLRAIFVAVASARTAVEAVTSLAWLVSQGQLWVVAPQPDGGDADLNAVSVPDLRASVQLLLAQAIENTREALVAAAA